MWIILKRKHPYTVNVSYTVLYIHIWHPMCERPSRPLLQATTDGAMHFTRLVRREGHGLNQSAEFIALWILMHRFMEVAPEWKCNLVKYDHFYHSIWTPPFLKLKSLNSLSSFLSIFHNLHHLFVPTMHRLLRPAAPPSAWARTTSLKPLETMCCVGRTCLALKSTSNTGASRRQRLTLSWCELWTKAGNLYLLYFYDGKKPSGLGIYVFFIFVHVHFFSTIFSYSGEVWAHVWAGCVLQFAEARLWGEETIRGDWEHGGELLQRQEAEAEWGGCPHWFDWEMDSVLWDFKACR